MKRQIKYFALYMFWGPVGAAAHHLPWRLVRAAARLSGVLVGRLCPVVGRRVRRQLRRLFPELTERKACRLADRTLQNWCLSELENMLQGRLIREGAYDRVPVSGRERLDAALARGRGVILLIAHFGAHLQVLPVLGFKGYSMNQLTNPRSVDDVAAAEGPPSFFERRYFAVQEKRHGKALPARMIVKGRFMRPLFECLARNDVLVMAIDGRQDGEVVGYPFLGCERFPFAQGPLALARKTGAAVMPAFVVRDVKGNNRLVIEKEIKVQDDRGAGTGVQSATAAFVRLLESYVRRYPDHCGQEFFSRDKLASATDGALEKDPGPRARLQEEPS